MLTGSRAISNEIESTGSETGCACYGYAYVNALNLPSFRAVGGVYGVVQVSSCRASVIWNIQRAWSRKLSLKDLSYLSRFLGWNGSYCIRLLSQLMIRLDIRVFPVLQFD